MNKLKQRTWFCLFVCLFSVTVEMLSRHLEEHRLHSWWMVLSTTYPKFCYNIWRIKTYDQVKPKALVPARLSNDQPTQYLDGWTLRNTKYHKPGFHKLFALMESLIVCFVLRHINLISHLMPNQVKENKFVKKFKGKVLGINDKL